MLIKDLPYPISEGKILDPYAGGMKWWKGLEQKDVMFVDKFIEGPKIIKASVVNLPFRDGVFDQIIADPPHFIRKSKFAPTCVLSHFGAYPTREELRNEWSLAAKEFNRVTKLNATLILKTIDGAKTVSQCCNNDDLALFDSDWKMEKEYRMRSKVPWSSAWTVFSFWKRRLNYVAISDDGIR